MPELVPIEHDPFVASPVDHDPFEDMHGAAPQGNVAGSVAGAVRSAAEGAADWWNRQPTWADRMHEQSVADQQAFAQGGPQELMKRDALRMMDLLGGFTGQVMGARGAATPIFRSAVEDAVAGAKQPKASADQWLGYLKNQPGVKQEELETLALPDLPKGSITKEQLSEHVAGNKVQLGEVWKGQEQAQVAKARQAEIQQRLNAIQNEFDARYNQNFGQGRSIHGDSVEFEIRRKLADEEQTLKSEYNRLNSTARTPTKHHQWQLPGGENYREMLLTLPSAPSKAQVFRDALAAKYESLGGNFVDHATKQEQDQLYKLMGQTREDQFQSSHWDEPNVLAHARMNDRVIDGDKTLHLEELQSDWHQKGRSQGYLGQQPPEQKALAAEREKLAGEVADMRGPLSPEWERRMDRITEINRQLNTPFGGPVGVPDAPFKTTWPDLLLKRMINHAVEKGYDAISWTPGEAQAARYDLSKHVREIQYEPPSGTGATDRTSYILTAKDNNGRTVDLGAHEPDKLEDAVGKDVADRIRSGAGVLPDNPYHPKTSLRVLRGLDLKVGGEGMQGFYDKMLPAKANALGKKYGAKVETKEMPQPSPYVGGHIIEDNRGFRIVNPSGSSRVFTTRAEAEKAMQGPTMPVHYMKITSALREFVRTKGFPLFAIGAGVFATKGGGNIQLIPVDYDPFAPESGL